MLIEVLKSKIHRVTVSEADLDYIGSITIDEDLMDAAGIIENEKVEIYNITNGERFATYAIRGERGTGVIGINGGRGIMVSNCDLYGCGTYGLEIDGTEGRERHDGRVGYQGHAFLMGNL